ncbi:hypothetical protein BC936DRAFT_139514 [Jimgerdemannia flammicorona]|uniref:Uncharacterized protein n=1 Tax=Jimgerdemannia flammicorona TaxID=994334 RepID=A0A433B9Q9_9FUNG|nr:hypothetical protein BC936DRAFT_139514 [Jimgerdemannia flammicorona]
MGGYLGKVGVRASGSVLSSTMVPFFESVTPSRKRFEHQAESMTFTGSMSDLRNLTDAYNWFMEESNVRRRY